MTTLVELGEDALIRRLVPLLPRDPDPLAGPGDDCAAIDPGPDSPILLLLKTDALVEHIHFLPDAPPAAVGWKAIARVASDFAAMGGRPERFLITLALPPNTSVNWAERLYQGMGDCLRQCGGLLAGGETSAVPPGSAKVIAIAATGSVRRNHLTLRSTAKPGDDILVTGTLGGSRQGKHLTFTPRLKQTDWLVSNCKPSAMMDLSDGLAKDLPRLAAASGCGFRLDRDPLPVTAGCTEAEALGDGEDFELLLCCRPDRTAPLLSAWSAAFPDLSLTCIGTMVEPAVGQSLAGGWDHFAPAP
jgi:thiamine-monophosphate kinase